MKPVLFVCMPFAGIDRPALGVSLLKSILAREGQASEVAYLNLWYAEMIGAADYGWVGDVGGSQECVPHTAMAGDWLFSQFHYGPGALDGEGFIEEILRGPTSRLAEAQIARIRALRATVARFIDRCLRTIRWDDYAIIGFTTTFEQNMASLALAARIKERYPHLVIVFGGANCEGPMGAELHEQYPFIDYVASGEADVSFPALVRALREGRSTDGIRGIFRRRPDGGTWTDGPAELFRDLDGLPYPDFDDYFAALANLRIGGTIAPALQMETARGCWWGERSHCSFCGLNGDTMRFRAKQPDRAFEELRYLVERHGVPHVQFVDNILDLGYLDTFLPRIAQELPGLVLFYETKSNLKPAHIRTLRAAGVRYVQPGIESLSTPVLKLMGKGVSALQNVMFLRECAAAGVQAAWNVLYGFPGEDPAEYQTVLARLEALTHLAPPDAVGQIRLDRFSPNYEGAASLGIENVRPLPAYQYIYPFDDEALARVCYFFEYDYRDGRNPNEYAGALQALWHEWRAAPPGTLLLHERAGGRAVIEDTRFNRVTDSIALDPVQREVYVCCFEPRTVAAVIEHLERRFAPRRFDAARVEALLQALVEERVMVDERGRYLSVALAAPRARKDTWRNRRASERESGSSSSPSTR